MDQRKALITTQFEAHFHAFASSVFCYAACPPSRKVVPSHEENVEVEIEYLEDKGPVSAYFTTCREPEKEIMESYISLCGFNDNQPVVLAQFDTVAEYLDYCARTFTA